MIGPAIGLVKKILKSPSDNEVPSDWALIGGGVLFAAVFANTAVSMRRNTRA